MFQRLISIIFVLVLVPSIAVSVGYQKRRYRITTSHSSAWLAGLGVGVVASPTLLLLSPHVEYGKARGFRWGALVQPGFGHGVLFTASGTVRWVSRTRQKVHPSVEVGLGLAAASSGFSSSSLGLNIHFGVGIDYQLTRAFSVGSIIRANLAPPVKSFYLSWPVAMARFAL